MQVSHWWQTCNMQLANVFTKKNKGSYETSLKPKSMLLP